MLYSLTGSTRGNSHMSALGIFANETEWMAYIEETDALMQVHGLRFVDKLTKELVAQFFDAKAGRMAIYDLRPAAVLADRNLYTEQLYARAIRETTVTTFQAIDMSKLKTALREVA
jgi:hypothetical protein